MVGRYRSKPGVNGFEFIRKVMEIKQVKVFFMSALQIDDIQFRTELPFVGIDEFIQKPVSKYVIVNQQMLKYQGS